MGLCTGAGYVKQPKKPNDRTLKEGEQPMCFGCGDPTHEEEGEYTGKPFVLAPVPELKKVFCDQCKSYKDSMIHESDIMTHKCIHPDIYNRSRLEADTPLTKGFTKKWTFPGDCLQLNRNNDCVLFDQIELPDRG